MGCCDELVQLGAPGEDGSNGVSCYVYIAWADDVTSGTPDSVTGFSLTTPTATSEWLGIIKSTTPIASPVAADFDNSWVKVKGADGSGSAGINIKVNNSTVSGGPFTTLDFLGAGLSGISGASAGGGEVDITIVTAGLITLTRAQALTLIGASGLIPGATYYIFDVGDGAGAATPYAGIILRAITESELAQDGVFIARVPDRTTINQWSHVGSYVLGDHVEDLNEVYTANTATTTPGENPFLLTEWDYESKDQDTFYKTEIHLCTYDVVNNALLKRWDARGNKMEVLGLPSGTNVNEVLLQCFRWGTDSVTGNNIILEASSAVGGWSTGRLPNDNKFIPNYTSGVFKNNTYYGSPTSHTFWSTLSTYWTLVDSDITECEFHNTLTNYADGSTIFSSRFINNTYADIILTGTISYTDFTDNCVLNNTGSNNIQHVQLINTIIEDNNDFTLTYSSLRNSTIQDNDTCSFSYLTGNLYITLNNTCTINYITGINNYSNTNKIYNNTNCNITDISGSIFFIQNNENIVIYDIVCNDGYIDTCVNTVSGNKLNCQLSQHKISQEGGFTNITWNTTGKIVRGSLEGTSGRINNVLIDNTVTATTTNVFGAAQTLAQVGGGGYVLDQFKLIHNGITGSAGAQALWKTSSPFSNYAHTNVTLSPTDSSFVAFVDASTSISVGGVLTIPAYAEHAGIILLYNAPAAAINQINLTSGAYANTYKGTRRLYKYSDAGTLTFTVTAIGTPPATNQLVGTAGAIVLNRPYDFVEIRKSGSYYTVENSKIVT